MIAACSLMAKLITRTLHDLSFSRQFVDLFHARFSVSICHIVVLFFFVRVEQVECVGGVKGTFLAVVHATPDQTIRSQPCLIHCQRSHYFHGLPPHLCFDSVVLHHLLYKTIQGQMKSGTKTLHSVPHVDLQPFDNITCVVMATTRPSPIGLSVQTVRASQCDLDEIADLETGPFHFPVFHETFCHCTAQREVGRVKRNRL